MSWGKRKNLVCQCGGNPSSSPKKTVKKTKIKLRGGLESFQREYGCGGGDNKGEGTNRGISRG